MKKNVGFIGWRGMVGSVLIKRMLEEKDFNSMSPCFFTTSQLGSKGPNFFSASFEKLEDAYNIEILRTMDIIVTCQGGEYTNAMYFNLRKTGWNGYWIDAASTLRMYENAVIVLDPINYALIKKSIELGVKTFIGSNCTVSIMLIALGGLFEADLIDWISVSTYQAASGAGAAYIKELLMQMYSINLHCMSDLNNLNGSILDIEQKITKFSRSSKFLTKQCKVPLIGNLIPWIDLLMKNGQTREEWKAQAEVNKIFGYKKNILIDGNCIRIGTLRCHSLSFMIKLKKDLLLSEIECILNNHNPWVTIVPNTEYETLRQLTPVAVSGTLNIPIGRLRKTNIGSSYLSAFSVGDQLLWGAAEPIRRMLKLLLNV